MSGRKYTPLAEKYGTIKVAGREFVEIPAEDAEKLIPHLREKRASALSASILRFVEKLGLKGDVAQRVAKGLAERPEFALTSPSFYHLPHRPRNDKLDFPGHPEFEESSPFLASGVALHDLEGEEGVQVGASGFSASQLRIFDSDIWAFECLGVLQAHNWIEKGNMSASLYEKLLDTVGEQAIDRAKRDYKENWEEFLFEVAASQFAVPFSRLWYAANMLSLYFSRHDDLRLGYLWCEYQMKLGWESDALKRRAMAETNRDNGKKGGQGQRAQERRAVLSRLVRDALKRTGRSAEQINFREVRRIAEAHDSASTNEERLFERGGDGLRDKWYRDWLKTFRQVEPT